ncbi:MAG: RHS repeat-associated core domain-containing protein [Candidatus Sulfotelmatobacter sp.]
MGAGHNGIVLTYGYDNDSRINSMSYQLGTNTVIGNLTYQYDADGRRIQVAGSLAATGFPQIITSAVYDVDNELKQWNGVNISYDANGNILNDGVTSYTWNARNQLIGRGTTIFEYDAIGRRILNPAGNSLLYKGSDVVQELASGTANENRILGGIDEFFNHQDSTGSYSPITDALGSVLALTNSSGNVTSQYSYDPFGNTTATGSPSSSAFQYTGRENDANGLYFYRARYYSPAFGRFVSQDATGFEGGINLYSYADLDPVNLRDPSGQTNVPIPAWGNWCGPNWTGGRTEEYNPLHDSLYKNPWPGGTDATCMHHDKCYYYCRADHPCDKGARANCMRSCDYTFVHDVPWDAGGLVLADIIYYGNSSPDAGDNAPSCRKP